MTRRRRFTADFKASVALEALRGDQTIQEIASRHKVHTNQVSTWKRQAMDGLGMIFSNGTDRASADHESTVHDLHAKIGQLTVANEIPGIFWPEGSSDEPGGAQVDDPAPPRTELEPPMRYSGNQPVVVLLHSEGREPGKPGADAAH